MPAPGRWFTGSCLLSSHRGCDRVGVGGPCGPPLDALDRLDHHDADVLITTRIDRLSRSVIDFSKMMQRARDNDWRMVVLQSMLTHHDTERRTDGTIIAACPQRERRILGARMKDAFAEKKRRGER